MIALAIASLPCIVWAYLLAARGGFWRAAQRDDAGMPAAWQDAGWPRIVAVIPARDEAPTISATIGSLLRQDYPGDLRIIVVDDHSGDGTAAAVRHTAVAAGASDRVTVLAAPGLPGGWTGKLWAVHQGVVHAGALPAPPDYLLLTDADIQFADDLLTDLVRRTVRDRLVLASLMARLHCQTFVERALLPAFIFFFQMLYPFAWVNRADRAMAAAAGGCVLVQLRLLQAAGGIEAIRGELIDDCALARLLKRHGPIWLGLTERVRSLRTYGSIGDIRSMIIRCAYAQLQFSPWSVAGVAVAMAVTFLAAPAFALLGDGVPQWLGALAWAQMGLAFQPTLRFYGVSGWWGLALPLIAGTYLLFTLDSACQHLRGKGGEWKGRFNRGASPDELPRHDS